jgi:hypothetical protein
MYAALMSGTQVGTQAQYVEGVSFEKVDLQNITPDNTTVDGVIGGVGGRPVIVEVSAPGKKIVKLMGEWGTMTIAGKPCICDIDADGKLCTADAQIPAKTLMCHELPRAAWLDVYVA